MSIRSDLMDEIGGILIDYGFDEDSSCVEDIINQVLDYFGISEEDDGKADSRLETEAGYSLCEDG